MLNSETDASFAATLQLAEQMGIISSPQMYAQPDDFPFHIAIAKIRPREGGSLPANTLKKRISTGFAWNLEEAKFLARCEGIERYSIQYSNQIQQSADSILSSGARLRRINIEEITIGSPSTEKEISSIGAACGSSKEMAIQNSLLEILEHHVKQNFSQYGLISSRINPRSIDSLIPVLNWLDSQFKNLEITVFQFSDGISVSKVALSDLSGARTTYGSAAALDIEKAATKACQEAILFWRNMIQLELNGIVARNLPAEENQALMNYRTSVYQPQISNSLVIDLPINQNKPTNITCESLISVISKIIEKEIQVFDLTDPDLGIPTVKAVRMD